MASIKPIMTLPFIDKMSIFPRSGQLVNLDVGKGNPPLRLKERMSFTV
jgi:hypothetical protein